MKKSFKIWKIIISNLICKIQYIMNVIYLIYILGRYRNICKNCLPILLCCGFLAAFIHDRSIQVGPSSQMVKSGPCVKNRSTIRKLFENNGSHIMKGFTCSVNKGDMVNFGFHYQIWIRHEKKCTFGIFSWWNHPTFCNVWIMSFEQGVKFWNWC